MPPRDERILVHRGRRESRESGFPTGEGETPRLIKLQHSGISCNYNALLIYFLRKDLNDQDNTYIGRAFLGVSFPGCSAWPLSWSAARDSAKDW